MSERALRPKHAKTAISRAMQVDRPVFLWGPPGIGKSDIVATIGRETNRPVIDMRLLLLEPTDIKGIPYYDPDRKAMRWATPSELPGKDEVDLHNAILFLDELNAAPPSVQAAAYQLILNRRVGEYELPEGVSILAAGNRETDKGVTFRMPSPLANRFVHLELTHHFDDWQKWAVNANVHADVVGFLSRHTQHLFNFNPKSPDKAFATPRSWTFVSDILADMPVGSVGENSTFPESLLTTMIAGTVGEGLAIEFRQHREVASKLPKPKDVLFGREKNLNTKDMSAMYSLTISMCYLLKELYGTANDANEKDFTMDKWNDCVNNFFTYSMDNFGTEMCILGAKTALRDYKLQIEHRKVKSFGKFHTMYGKYILDD